MSKKTSVGKFEKLTIIVSIISLASTIGLTIFNFALVNQANKIAEANLDFQNMLSNFTSIIIADTDYAILGEPSIILSVNDTIEETTHYGYLQVNVQVITPHFGILKIKLKDFYVGESPMHNPERKNETRVSFADENKKYEYPVVLGLNPINATLHLKAVVYPNLQNLPPDTQSVQFPIGVQHFEAELLDIQTNKTTVKEFYALICVVMKFT